MKGAQLGMSSQTRYTRPNMYTIHIVKSSYECQTLDPHLPQSGRAWRGADSAPPPVSFPLFLPTSNKDIELKLLDFS